MRKLNLIRRGFMDVCPGYVIIEKGGKSLSKILSDLMMRINITGDIQKDMVELFNFYERQDIAEHSMKVDHEAKKCI